LGATVSTLLVGEGVYTPVGLVLAGSSLIPGQSGLIELLASGIDPMDLRKDPGELSTNAEYAEQLRRDPLVWQGGLRPETLRALAEASVRIGNVLQSLTLPTLFLHGSADDLASAELARAAADQLPAAKAVIYPGKLHNILNESNRDEVYGDLVAFIRTL
jgi:alpha-beta hydrolase superfamily lysophospholipase